MQPDNERMRMGIYKCVSHMADQAEKTEMWNSKTGGRDCMVADEVSQGRALLVSRVLLWRWFEIEGHLVVTLGKRICMIAYEVFQDKLFEWVECYLKGGLEMATYSWHWGKDSIHSLFRSPRRQISSSQLSSTQKMLLKWLFISDTGEDSTHLLFSSPGRQSICWETELSRLVEFYSEDGLQMALHWWH